jgi:hypothetical protein
VSPLGRGARVMTIPIDTMLRKKISRYLFTASRFFLKNLYMIAPANLSLPLHYRRVR